MIERTPTAFDKLIVLFLLVAFSVVALWPMPVWDKVLFMILLVCLGAMLFELQGRLS